MLVISMRTRRSLGIKTRSIVISPGYALVLVLALALAAFSLIASIVLIALAVLIVSAALTVLDAEAAVADAAEAVVEAVAADTRLINMRKGKPLSMQGLFI